jgi:hypothetical protein
MPGFFIAYFASSFVKPNIYSVASLPLLFNTSRVFPSLFSSLFLHLIYQAPYFLVILSCSAIAPKCSVVRTYKIISAHCDTVGILVKTPVSSSLPSPLRSIARTVELVIEAFSPASFLQSLDCRPLFSVEGAIGNKHRSKSNSATTDGCCTVDSRKLIFGNGQLYQWLPSGTGTKWEWEWKWKWVGERSQQQQWE